jgi:hypothetical protein
MALIVKIFINNNCIITKHCRRDELKLKGFNEVHTYTTDDGRKIKHKYSDGAEVLAVKLLKNNEVL